MVSSERFGAWVRQLRPRPEAHIEPVCSTDVLERAVEQIGTPAVEWAIQVARDIAAESIEMYPIFGKGLAQLATVRLASESVALAAIRSLDSDELTGLTTPTADAIRATQDYVHRGIPLPIVWKAMQQGHAHLAKALMTACVDLVPAHAQPRQLQRTSEILFAYIKGVFDGLSDAYTAEHERWMATTRVAREQAIAALLAGSPSDTQATEALLRYSLAHRSHIAISLWLERTVGADDTTLQKAACRLLEAVGAEQTLVVPRGLSMTHAWGNAAHDLQPRRLAALLDGDDIRCSVGRVHRGVAGFADTYRDAEEARKVAEAMRGLGASVLFFDDVRLMTLLAQDMDKLRLFISEALGPLAGDGAHVAELRATAVAYLRLKRSPLAVANEFYVARNTVGYRLKRVEEMLGRTLEERTLETWVALAAKEALGDADTSETGNPQTSRRRGSSATLV